MKSRRDLKEIIESRVRLFKKKPEAAQYRPTVVTEWKGGLLNENKIRDHILLSDYPSPAGGDNKAPNPMEALLAALGSCVSAVYVEYAATLDMKLDSVTVELSGAIDLRGLFNVDPDVSPGFEKISYTVTIKTSEPKEKMDELISLAESHCPVSDSLKRVVAVDRKVNVEPTGSD
ncbi:hypothetical protein MNBD_NITROSPINAE04-304 [hydrothermal vent metagenome]|uniref:OsmC family protein n=1 Tax=hydrothermal vent metagenome TaxID=652676 RepID=A0A3B1C886_9ZZZZ